MWVRWWKVSIAGLVKIKFEFIFSDEKFLEISFLLLLKVSGRFLFLFYFFDRKGEEIRVRLHCISETLEPAFKVGPVR